MREVDREFSHTYGYGGMSVLLALACYGYAVWFMGWYTHVWAYVVAVAIALIALRIVSAVVKRTRPRLRSKVQAYCDANGFAVEELTSHFKSENMYPYFVALFEESAAAKLERQ
ncbi:MAG: hypothetical protein R3E66_03735 [bacterium]